MNLSPLSPLNFLRGFLLISLLILGVAFSVQSCSEDPPPTTPVERELGRAALEADLRHGLPTIQNLIINKGEGLGQKEIEKELYQALSPSLYSSKKVLATYGVDQDFLIETFGSADDPRIVTAALILAGNNSVYKNNHASVFPALFIQPEKDDGKEWFDCAIRAVGIDAVMEMLNGRITDAIAKKAIKKIATRTLGWVGAAIAAYEFANCMGWV